MDALSPILLKRIQRLERQQQDRRASMVGPRRNYPLPTGGGPECVQIVGFTAGNLGFSVKRLDQTTGAVVGDAFNVLAFSLPRVGGAIGQQNVATNCHPSYVIGDPLDIEYRRRWTGTAWVVTYWAVDTFDAFGC